MSYLPQGSSSVNSPSQGSAAGIPSYLKNLSSSNESNQQTQATTQRNFNLPAKSTESNVTLPSYAFLGNKTSQPTIQRNSNTFTACAQSQVQITRKASDFSTYSPSYKSVNQQPQSQFISRTQPVINPQTIPNSSENASQQTFTPPDQNEIQLQRETLAAFGFSIDEEAYFSQPPKQIDINALPDLLLSVQQDPRYKRLLFKYAPPKSNPTGLIQYAKNKVDPSHLPGFGIFVNSYRTVKLTKHKKTFQQTDKTTYSNDNLSLEAHQAIEVGLEAQMTKQGVKTGLEIALKWIPIINMIPLGHVIKVVGYKGAEKATNKQNKTEGLEGKALADYKHTRAFLLYLGFPSMNDPLYAKWEAHRIHLKQFFGATADEDLYEMMNVWKEYEIEQKRVKNTPEGVPIEHQAPISMLLMMWRVYDCWDKPYYDQLISLKEKIKTVIFKFDSQLPEAELNRIRDAKLLGYNPNYDHDPHVELAPIEYLDSIVRVLVNQYQETSRLSYIESQSRNLLETENKLEKMLQVLVKHFIEKHQVWVYVENDEYKTIRAVALWEPPHRDPALPLSKIQRLKLAKSIGMDVNRIFFTDQEQTARLRREHYEQIQSDMGILHFFAYWHDEDSSAKYKFCLTVLLFDLVEALPPFTPAYAHAPEDQSWYLREIGFTQMPLSVRGHPNIVPIHGFLYIREDE